MKLKAQSQAELSGDRRYAARRPIRIATSLRSSGMGATIHDLSLTGMLLETAEELAVNDLLVTELPNFGHVSATVVWNSERFFGCRFDQPLPAGALSGAILRNPFTIPKATADVEMGIESPLSAAEEPKDDKLPVPVRLVLMLVLGVAVCAPVVGVVALLA